MILFLPSCQRSEVDDGDDADEGERKKGMDITFVDRDVRLFTLIFL